MRFVETFRTAYEALRAHRMRSTLTVLGILIGIAAVMLTVALGDAARAMVLKQINSMGSNLMIIVPGNAGDMRPGSTSGFTQSLTVADAAALADESIAPDVAGVAATNETSTSVRAGSEEVSTTITGTSPEWLPVRARSVTVGRMFTEDEMAQGSRVAVLGTTVSAKLFAGRDPIGQTVTIAGQNLTVIGLLDHAGSTMGMDNDDLLLLPRTTLVQRIGGGDPNLVSMIYLQATSPEKLGPAYNQINNTLLVNHGKGPGDADFMIYTQQSLIDTANSTTAILTTLLGSIAAVSLLVGGIGVMDIMVVLVTERVREIGLRKALGATPSMIRRQFLVEASMLGLLGGTLGLLLGLGAGAAISAITKFPVVPSLGAALVALGVSLLIGVIAGVYPASRAARLAPIDALRNE